MLREDNELLTRVGPGTPMGEVMRRYWIPAAFSDQVKDPDSPPIRVKLLGEKLVLFRDTDGRVGLLDERCPHRTASLFYGRNEECGLRCVYHGLKFDVDGHCVDLPGIEPGSPIQKNMRVTSYPCLERGDIVWTYMGPAALKPEFPELEWTMVPSSHRFATRHIQECNWLQGFDGGFDPAHLSFLHSGPVDLRKGGKDKNRRIAPTLFETMPTDFGYLTAGGRDLGNGTVVWHVELMMVPFHKIIPSTPLGAHVWAPMDDETTMLYSINFHPSRALTDADLEREKAWGGIHTENIPGTDRAILNRDNDYKIDRALQASKQSYTGIRGLGIQDCAMQESMGPIADRTLEHLLPIDQGMVKVRRRMLQIVKDHMAGKPLPGLDPASYRVRGAHIDAPKGVPLADFVMDHIRTDARLAAE
jgi:phthalate 4,5-dioxygenase oxygenase subunit